MADQSGDVTGGVSPSVSTPQVAPIDVSTTDLGALSMAGPGQSAASFGAPASTFATGAPAAGGGGAVSAPGPSAPPSSPAGFGGGVQLPGGGLPNVPENVPDATVGGAAAVGTAGGVGGGMGGGSGGGTVAHTNSILSAIQNPGADSIMNAVGSNLGPLASLGILGFEAANKPGGIGGSGQQLPAAAQPGPTAGALVNQAGTLQTAGQALSQPLATGVLPPGPQAAVDQLTKSQEAQIRSQFASMGLSGSTMEATALQTVAEQAQARGFQIAQQMAQQGLSDMQLSSNIFTNLLNSGLQSDQEFQQALTQFAASLAGGSAKAA